MGGETEVTLRGPRRPKNILQIVFVQTPYLARNTKRKVPRKPQNLTLHLAYMIFIGGSVQLNQSPQLFLLSVGWLWSICIALCAWCGLPVACNPSVRRRSSGGCGGISLTPPTHPPCSTSSFSPSYCIDAASIDL